MTATPDAPASIEAPFRGHGEVVKPEWIDYSGHMNVGYFLLPFENAAVAFFRWLDLSREYRARTGHALFVAEAHLTFARELRAGDRLAFTTQLLGWGGKWVHCFFEMHNADPACGPKPYGGRRPDNGYLAATCEKVYIHMNLEARRSAPFPDDAQVRLRRVHAAHAKLPRPPQAGRAITPRGGTEG